MEYEVRYSAISLRVLRKMPRRNAERIQQKIMLLAKAPHAPNANVKSLQGRDGYRLRVGDWRVIYSLEDEIKTLAVENIGARGSIYQ